MASSATKHSSSIVNIATGSFTGAAAIEVVTCGFTPRKVEIFNETGVIHWMKLDDMGATICMKTVTAGTMTADATTAITLDEQGFTCSAALAASAEDCSWIAIA